MLPKQRATGKVKRGATEFHGIGRDAAQLGVTRVHLWLVLKGKRESRPLIRRYQQLRRAA